MPMAIREAFDLSIFVILIDVMNGDDRALSSTM